MSPNPHFMYATYTRVTICSATRNIDAVGLTLLQQTGARLQPSQAVEYVSLFR